MIVVKSGEIFINFKLTKDPELIGYAFLDWVENNPQAELKLLTEKHHNEKT